jgi:hypothetical protein
MNFIVNAGSKFLQEVPKPVANNFQLFIAASYLFQVPLAKEAPTNLFIWTEEFLYLLILKN